VLYELRLYQCGMGRAQDVSNRLRDLVPPEFRKHGLPVPSAQWFATSGPKLPVYAWMLAWPNSEVRAQAFGDLWADPAYQEIRAQTNGDSEMVEKYDIFLMHQTRASETIAALHGSGAISDRLHELRIHEIYPGKMSYAIERMRDVDLPALKAAGATSLGLFDVQSGGRSVPALAHFLTWPNYEARETGLAAYASNPEVEARNGQEVKDLRTHAVGRHDTWLLRPAEFCPPLRGLASRPWYDTDSGA
jgi:hypothetical protein